MLPLNSILPPPPLKPRKSPFCPRAFSPLPRRRGNVKHHPPLKSHPQGFLLKNRPQTHPPQTLSKASIQESQQQHPQKNIQTKTPPQGPPKHRAPHGIPPQMLPLNSILPPPPLKPRKSPFCPRAFSPLPRRRGNVKHHPPLKSHPQGFLLKNRPQTHPPQTLSKASIQESQQQHPQKNIQTKTPPQGPPKHRAPHASLHKCFPSTASYPLLLLNPTKAPFVLKPSPLSPGEEGM